MINYSMLLKVIKIWLFFFILFIVLLFSNIKINIIFNRAKYNDNIEIVLYIILNLIQIRFKIPYVDLILNKETKKDDKNYTRYITKIKKDYKENKKYYQNIINYILQIIKIDNLFWITNIGIEDAANTAMIAGYLNILQNIIVSFISKKIYLRKKNIGVMPIYSKIVFQTYFNCIIKIKIANIIITIVKFIFSYLMRKYVIYSNMYFNKTKE